MIPPYARRARTVVKASDAGGVGAASTAARAPVRRPPERSAAQGISAPEGPRRIMRRAEHVLRGRRRIRHTCLVVPASCTSSAQSSMTPRTPAPPALVRLASRLGATSFSAGTAAPTNSIRDDIHEAPILRPGQYVDAKFERPEHCRAHTHSVASTRAQQTRRENADVLASNAEAFRGVSLMSTAEPPTVPPPVA
jgi:hypothetical protein